jgi:hypothetical protein
MGQLIADIEEGSVINMSCELSHVRCLMNLSNDTLTD